jgi:hypothetical protein
VSYTIRNSIVLGSILFVLFSVGSYLTMFSLPKSLKRIETEINKLQVDLQNTPDLANQYNVLSQRLVDVKARWETRSKDIPARDVTGETYGYFNSIIEQSGEVKMDMTYVGPKELNNYGYNAYTLKGEAPFANLYRFVWYTENGRRLFKISNLVLRGYETKVRETGETKILVLYDMELQAYYSSIPELNIAPAQRTVTPAVFSKNPFYPLILREIPPPQPDEIEIERSDLKAVIPGKAFIVDQNQKSRVLQEGDPVYLGYVTKIFATEGKMECLLNKGGVTERFVLSIRAGQPLK